MIKNPKGTDFPQGEDGDSEIEKVVSTTTTKASTSSVSVNANSTPWLRLKDPRIVRVSRVFGGKDRHSKVCTIRGLRDRRVRLSVPTAIQLYDLQDRLGLNQPSKVVDWLLNAAKHEIDELPPLPMPLPGSFSLLAAAAATTHRGEAILARANSSVATTSQLSNDHQDQGVVVKANSHDHDHHSSGIANFEWELGNSSGRLGRSSSSNFWSPNASYSNTALWRARSKEVVPARDYQTANENEKESLRGTRNNINNEGGLIDQKEELGNIDLTLLQRTTTMNHHPLIFPGMINNIITNSIPASTNHRWEPPNFPLLMSHLGGGSSGLAEHNNHSHSLNVVSVQPSTLSLSTGSQFLFGLPSSSSSGTSSTTQTYMPNIGMEIHHDPRSQGMSHFQMLSSSLSVQNLLPNPAMRSLYHFSAANSTNDDNIGSPSQQGNKERE